MPINSNIALGVQPVQIADPMAQYAKVAAIQGVQQQNRLADLQMRQYEIEQNNKNVLAQAYAQSFDPASGKLDYNKLTGLLAQGGQGTQIPGILKQRTEEERAATEEAARRAKLMQATETMYRNLSNQIGSKQDAAAFLQRMVNDPAMKDSPIARIPLMQQIQRIPDDPQGLDSWVKQFSLGATKYITENKPVTFAQETGGGGRLMSRPGLGGAATVVQGSEFTKTPTIGEITAQGQLKVTQDRLAFDKAKEEWQRANPGYELKEGDDGTIYGVNKRTLQAMPVMMGGTAPAAAPAAPAAGGPRVPQAGAGQAIPGMPSVLDQPVVAAPVAGAQPLKGKGTALNEGQGNATAFGMRMAESHKLLSELEKAGTTSGGRIKGAVQGTLSSLVPYQGEKLAEGAGAVMNVLPGFLGGPNENQQAYMQGKENFITAVLRKESGAAIGADEYLREDRKYFPQAGDSEKVIKQKQRARELAIQAMKIQAGPGAKSIGGAGALPSANANIPGASANNPLGLPGL